MESQRAELKRKINELFDEYQLRMNKITDELCKQHKDVSLRIWPRVKKQLMLLLKRGGSEG